MVLNAAEKRFQRNAVIIAARELAYQAVKDSVSSYISIGKLTTTVTKGTTPKTYGFDFSASGTPFLRAEEVVDGEVKYSQTPYFIDHQTNDFMQRSKTQSGDVLVTIAGSVGRAAVVPEIAPELNMNQAVALVRCKHEVDPYFLCHMLQSKSVQLQISGSTVTSAISNLSLGKIKEIVIPLPDRKHQIGIASFLEGIRTEEELADTIENLPEFARHLPSLLRRFQELATKVEEARELRSQSIKECDNLCRSIIFNQSIETTSTPMEELVTLRAPDVDVDPAETYSFAGVYSFGRGVFVQRSLLGIDFSYKKLTRLKTGNFVYPKLMAWEGALGIVPELCNNLVVSPEFPVFEVNCDKVLPDTLDVFFRTPAIWPTLAQLSTGTNVRRRRLNPSNFMRFQFPLPDMKIQKKLQEVRRRLEPVNKLQTQTANQLNALLPAILDKAFKGEL